MIDSKGSVVECDQGSHDWLPGVPVVPDRGGQGQDALQDPDGDAGDGTAAVLFKIELALKVWLTDSMFCHSARSR